MWRRGVKFGDVMIPSPLLPRSANDSGETVPCRSGGPPGVGPVLLAEGEPEDLEGLLIAAARLLERDAESPELLGLVPPADADANAPAAQHVERGDVLGETQRIVEGEDEHSRPDRDVLRPVRDRHAERERVPEDAVP
jgi:hypothetical protein